MTDAEREARLRHAVEVGPYPPIDYWGDETAFLLRLLDEARAVQAEMGEVSDGYHKFNELYEHRHALFIALCRQMPLACWRSRRHADGSMYDGYFVIGIWEEPSIQISYHLPIRLWSRTDFVKTLDRALEWDGHTSADVIERLYKGFPTPEGRASAAVCYFGGEGA
jgi:hypothetical protein